MKRPEKDSISNNFVSQIIKDDLASGKHQQIRTRFPPEPNGFLHIGHAKSLCLNFGLAALYGGQCNLRFDDTNPEKEEQQYIDGIKNDIRWLGYQWENLCYASDYFDKLYDGAIDLIKNGQAYVDEQDEEAVKLNRGDINTPGTNSPYRTRSIDDNLRLFREMREGKHGEGSMVLRAKIDMAHNNPLMRDPPMYRIKFATHPHTKDKWCIYPLYDYAHGQSDSYEGITHSICTTEFEVHRPLYEWYQENMNITRSQQIEFARLNITKTVMSKRKLMILVNKGLVNQWDDPRMPTLCGMRRRGYTAEGIKDFCNRVGVAKRDNLQSIDLLERCIRESLEPTATRVFGIVDPLLVEITNWPEGHIEELEAKNHPTLDRGTRNVYMTRQIYIEKSDFMETPDEGFLRLSPGMEVRLRWAYWLKCINVVKENDKIVKIECTYDPETRGGSHPSDGRKVKATLHWLSAEHSKAVEYRLYDNLFCADVPDAETDWLDNINPNSLVTFEGMIEKDVSENDTHFQLERMGYFTWDIDSQTDNLIMNRTCKLIDSFEKGKTGAEEKNKILDDRAKKAAERAAIKAARAERKANKNIDK